MSRLKKDEFGNVIIPTFPDLTRKLNAAQEEAEWITREVLPKLREVFPADSGKRTGLTTQIIRRAVEIREFMPDVPKRDLRYAKFLVFRGRAMVLDRESFMFDYDLSAEGIERKETIKEFESLPDSVKKHAIVQR